ncbi:MAG: hypothetical protein AB7I27_01315 [Bacteriovoracaceae bacterium]
MKTIKENLRQFGVGTLIALSFCCAKVTLAQTGDRVGNGGDAIVCPNRVVLLDYHEMEQRDQKLNLPGRSMRERVENALARIKKMDKARAALVESYALELLADLEKKEQGETSLPKVLFTKDILSDVDDSLELTIPAGCEKKQLVVQRAPVFPGDRRYTIAEDIWQKMDQEQRSLTILHEAWYRTFIDDGSKDSRLARYMNSVFASEEADKMSVYDYLEKLSISSNLGGMKTYQVTIKHPISMHDELETVLLKLSPLSVNPEERRYKVLSVVPSIAPSNLFHIDYINYSLAISEVVLNTRGEMERMIYRNEGDVKKTTFTYPDVITHENWKAAIYRFEELTVDSNFKVLNLKIEANAVLLNNKSLLVREKNKHFKIELMINDNKVEYKVIK